MPSSASDTPGHPARGRYDIAAGLLAHGSTLTPSLPEAYASVASTGEARRSQLRGQLRLCRPFKVQLTEFPLSSGSTTPENHDMDVMGSGAWEVNPRNVPTLCAGWR